MKQINEKFDNDFEQNEQNYFDSFNKSNTNDVLNYKYIGKSFCFNPKDVPPYYVTDLAWMDSEMLEEVHDFIGQPLVWDRNTKTIYVGIVADVWNWGCEDPDFLFNKCKIAKDKELVNPNDPNDKFNLSALYWKFIAEDVRHILIYIPTLDKFAVFFDPLWNETSRPNATTDLSFTIHGDDDHIWDEEPGAEDPEWGMNEEGETIETFSFNAFKDDLLKCDKGLMKYLAKDYGREKEVIVGDKNIVLYTNIHEFLNTESNNI